MKPNLFSTNIIEIYDLKEFLKFAENAPLVIYDPLFFSTPFLDEKKMKSVNCYAVGIKFDDYPVILKYQKTWKNLTFQRTNKVKNPKDVIDSSLQVFINQLTTRFHAIKGKIHEEKEKPIWNEII